MPTPATETRLTTVAWRVRVGGGGRGAFSIDFVYVASILSQLP
jgi:hypothetical protein